MRRVVLDTETTGLCNGRKPVCTGHRIIEIGCVEIVDDCVTGRTFHAVLDPKQAVDASATAIHGMTYEFLRGRTEFKDIVQGFIQFIGSSTIIIHNAPFDICFLDQEFDKLPKSLQPTNRFSYIDTLTISRKLFPCSSNKLSALQKRFQIDIPRHKHGALTDALILAHISLVIV